MKFITLFFIIPFLFISCSKDTSIIENSQSGSTISTNTWIELVASWSTQTTSWEIIEIPKHEQTTNLEEDFSKDLNELLQLIDDESNE